MIKRIIYVALVISMLSPVSVFAQDKGEFERMHIDIWPEYDRPEVLVIYRITLSSVMTLPAEISLRIPKTVGKPYNVAMKDIDGLLYPLNYQTDNEDQWLRITFFTPSPDLQIEFYDPLNSCEDNQRCFSFIWPGDYTVDSLTITVQQPLNSKDMHISPDMGTGQLRPDELRYYTTLVGTLRKNESYSVNIRYEKTDNTLSASMQPVEPITPIDQDTAGRTSFQEMLPWVIGVLGMIMIISVGLWVWSSDWRVSSTSEKLSPTLVNQEKNRFHDKPDVYCSKCGKRASEGDVFCRTCGEKLLSD